MAEIDWRIEYKRPAKRKAVPSWSQDELHRTGIQPGVRLRLVW